MALAGCRSSAPHPVRMSAPGTHPPGTLILEPCQARTSTGTSEAECGTLLVPLDHEDPSVGTLALPVVRFRSTGPVRRAPIFYLGGGPGESNLGHRPHPVYLEDGDYVLLGYRGSDGSVVLHAPEIRRALMGGDGDLLSAASLEGIRRGAEAAAHRFRAEGIDLNHFTVREVIGDLEAAREALGYGRIHLRGGSFGTRVALIYQELHPDRIHRSVLTAPNPPGGFVWEPEVVERMLLTWDTRRAEAHPPGADPRSLTDDMARALANLPPRRLGIPLDPGRIRVTTFALLFDMRTAESVAEAYAAAAEGDHAGLALLSLGYRFALPGRFVWGAMASMGASLDQDPGRDLAVELDLAGAVLGSPLGAVIWAMAPAMGIERLPEPFRDLHGSATPTLLITGALDFSTPPERVDAFLPLLANGHHLVIPNRGHLDLFRGWEAEAREMIRVFFLNGEVHPPGVENLILELGTSGLLNLPRTARWGAGALVGLVVISGALGARAVLR